jgi:hypothetical protein
MLVRIQFAQGRRDECLLRNLDTAEVPLATPCPCFDVDILDLRPSRTTGIGKHVEFPYSRLFVRSIER